MSDPKEIASNKERIFFVSSAAYILQYMAMGEYYIELKFDK